MCARHTGLTLSNAALSVLPLKLLFLFSVLLKKSFIHMIKYVLRKKVYKSDGSFKGSRNVNWCEKVGEKMV